LGLVNGTQMLDGIILPHVQSGNTVIFLGAGTSASAGAPETKELIRRIKENFPLVDENINDFNRICSEIKYIQGYGLSKLYSFIQKQFQKIFPTSAHEILTHYDWAAIFTTNYDDLIEQSYRKTKSFRYLNVVRSPKERANLRNREFIHLFKLMGDATRNFGEEGAMILTEEEKTRNIQERTRHYDYLFDLVMDGAILFIGYSFRDLIALNVMNQLENEYGRERLPDAFAFFSDLSSLRPAEINRLKELKIEPIEMKFEDFMKYLSLKFDARDMDHNYGKDYILKINNTDVILSSIDVSLIEQYCEILHEKALALKSSEIKDFFRGKDYTWGVFRQDWDFKRYIYTKGNTELLVPQDDTYKALGLRDLILKEMDDFDPVHNKLIVISGMPGLGKTVLSRRLAYDVYSRGNPVIILKPSYSLYDHIPINNFCRLVTNKYIELKKSSDLKHKDIKFLIISDDVSNTITFFMSLKSVLASLGFAALILGFDRQGRWKNRKRRLSVSRYLEDEIYEVYIKNEVLEEEKEDLIEYLKGLNIIEPTKELSTEWFDEETSFFGLLYSLVDDSQLKFDQIIRNQFLNLRPIQQRAFLSICIFYQYNLSINYEFLRRILDVSWEEAESILDECSGIIYEEEDKYGNHYYRCHHRIIAEKTLEFFMPDPYEHIELLKEILSKSYKYVDYERTLCERLLIENLSRSRHDRDFPFTFIQLDEIFESVCRNAPTSGLLHHWALIKIDLQQLREAEKLCLKALSLSETEKQERFGEKIPFILNTLGRIYSFIGINLLKQNEEAKANLYFNMAQKKFHEAKEKGHKTDSVTYYSEALMNMQRGEKTGSMEGKIKFFSQSLEILEEGLSNTNESEQKQMKQLYLIVLQRLRPFSSKLEDIAKELLEKYNDVSGYYIIAAKHYNRAQNIGLSENEQNFYVSKALQIVDFVLDNVPNDVKCLSLKIKILNQYKPEGYYSTKKFFELLKIWARNSGRPNLHWLYLLGKIAFEFHQYKTSEVYFEKLRKLSRGLHTRLAIRDTLPGQHLGEIVEIKNIRRGLIHCKTRKEPFNIIFNPTYSKNILRKGETVRFSIAFNYCGPLAINIERLI